MDKENINLKFGLSLILSGFSLALYLLDKGSFLMISINVMGWIRISNVNNLFVVFLLIKELRQSNGTQTPSYLLSNLNIIFVN